MGLITAAAGGGNWTVGGTWVGGVAPTAADDALLSNLSGNVTINSGALARSVDCTAGTGYTGVLTHNSAVNMQIGDGTAGASSIALKFSAGMTYTKLSTTTSAFTFISSSGTQQTVTTAGKTMGNVIFNNATGSWQLQDTFTSAATFTLTAGTLDTNNQAVNVSSCSNTASGVRTLTLGSTIITMTSSGTAAAWGTGTNLTMTANTGTLVLTGTAALGNFPTGATTNYNGMSIQFTGSGIQAFAGNCTMANLTRTGTTSVSDGLTFANATTFTGNIVFNGNSSGQRLLISSDTRGTARILTVTGTYSGSNWDLSDITKAGGGSGDLSALSSVGNGDGNTGFTFPTAANRYAVVAGNYSSTATWSSTSGGAGGSTVPVLQDNVFFDASSAAGTYTFDEPRVAGFDATNFTRTMTASVGPNIYGSMTLGAGMTKTSGGVTWTIYKRGTTSITSSAIDFADALTWDTLSTNACTLNDTFSATNKALTQTSGTLTTTGINVTAASFTSSNSNTRALTLGTATWTLSGTGTVWNFTTTIGLTFSGANATVVITDTSASAKGYTAGGTISRLTYPASTSGAVSIAVTCTLTDITVSGTGTAILKFPSLGTVTLTGGAGSLPSGTSASHLQFQATAAGTRCSISSATTLTPSYVDLKDQNGAGAGIPHIATNGIDVLNNANWNFVTTSSGSPNLLLMGVGQQNGSAKS